MRKNQRIALYKIIWGKIRYWQSLQELPDSTLAGYLQVTERTMRDYDKNAKNLTLEKIDNFLLINNMNLTDLLSL